MFAGFLPAKGAERKRRLAELAAGPWAIALFEAPHRIEATLADLHAALGERDVVVCRELTKLLRDHRARAARAGASPGCEADANRSRGEFVLVVEGRPVEAATAVDPARVLETLLAELSVKQAVGARGRRSPAPTAASFTQLAMAAAKRTKKGEGRGARLGGP